MVKKFENSTHPMRALQAWLILIGQAQINREPLTYGELGEKMNFPYFGLARVLGYIKRFCELNDLPPLTVLVVNQKTGIPGSGLGEMDYDSERERVLALNWYSIMPPTLEELSDLKR